MRKWTIAIFSLGIGLAGSFLYYATNENSYSITGWFAWMESFVSRGIFAAQALTSGNATDIAVSFIANQEGFSATAYPDPPGQSSTYSIGYGHQIVPGDGLNTSSTITESQASDLLYADVQTAVDCVQSQVSQTLTDNQLAALISFTYNEGCGAFAGSTLLKDINAGDFVSATQEFSRWVYAGNQVVSALVTRRSDEQQLFNS